MGSDYKVLTPEELKSALKELQGWAVDNGLLTKKFHFSGFTSATSFVYNEIRVIANKLNHHPDVHVLSYRVVRVETITHDVGYKVTNFDVELAKKIQAAYDKLPESDKKFDTKA